MERHVMWVPASEPGFEHLKLTELPHRVTASGLIIGLSNNVPYRVHYEIGCDVDWGVRRKVLYVSAPTMTLKLDQQRYSCLERFESLPSGFTAQLTVDRDGTVIEYPDGWRRVLPEGGN